MEKMGGTGQMATNVRELTKQAVDELLEEEAMEVLDFIGYLYWRREGRDQSWFWTEEWQERYREAKTDLVEGRSREFDDVEDLLAELKS
jgi:phosphoglycolate phosphatase-like HAD superfamily hydrolase